MKLFNCEKNVISKMYSKIIYVIYMHKMYIELNNLQWLICNETQSNPNNIYLIYMYKRDLTLNNLQLLICHWTKANQIIYIQLYVQRGSGIKWPTMVDMP